MIDKLIDSTPGNEIPKLLEEAGILFKDQNFEEALKAYENLIGWILEILMLLAAF